MPIFKKKFAKIVGLEDVLPPKMCENVRLYVAALDTIAQECISGRDLTRFYRRYGLVCCSGIGWGRIMDNSDGAEQAQPGTPGTGTVTVTAKMPGIPEQ